MHTNAALRLLSALVLSSALACGSDPSGDSDDDESTSKSDSKGTGTIKTVKKDAGTAKKDAKVDDEEEESDDEEEVQDAGKGTNRLSCEVDEDCDPPKGSGISCCDVPTSVCYTWRSSDTCPVSTPTEMMPEYN